MERVVVREWERVGSMGQRSIRPMGCGEAEVGEGRQITALSGTR